MSPGTEDQVLAELRRIRHRLTAVIYLLAFLVGIAIGSQI